MLSFLLKLITKFYLLAHVKPKSTPMSHIKHLITSETSGEGISSSQFNFLMERIEVNEDGMVRIADLVTLIQQK